MRLEPLSQFVLARGLEDHTDSGTYYVQAVIRDGKTDQIIGTVALDDKGDRRFTKAWQVPADPTGEGRDILITYTVYTDEACTTKAENYGEKFADYRVEHIPKHQGGGGSDISYKKVREIVAEELKKLPPYPEMPEIKIPEMPNMAFHMQPVLNAITGLRNDIAEIDIPIPDFSAIEFRLDSLEKAIKAIETPETDRSPVLKAISEARTAITSTLDQPTKTVQQIAKDFDAAAETLTKTLEGFTSTVKNVPFVSLQLPKDKEPKEDINYNELL